LEPENSIIPLDILEFNDRLVPPEVLHTLCYVVYWENVGGALEDGCPSPPDGDPTCAGYEFLAPLIDPQIDMMCEQ
jgi:hypothetical protein